MVASAEEQAKLPETLLIEKQANKRKPFELPENIAGYHCVATCQQSNDVNDDGND
jgi:hypothetical protein